MGTGGKDVVTITGGAGFLGQHIVRELQTRRAESLSEIRIVDLKEYRQRLHHPSPVAVRSFVGDVRVASSLREAFSGASCVMHCAALVSYSYPPDRPALEEANVAGTRNVIAACLEAGVPRLVFTSTAEVCMVPYAGRACPAVIVNSTESKARPADDAEGFLVPGYADSKHRAEQLVLAADCPRLRTTALRPVPTYGEEDPHLFASMVGVASKLGGRIPKIGGAGGKQQTAYAGNVAWAHLCAMDALAGERPAIAGLPAFVTDDSPVEDATRTCERLTGSLCTPNRWFVPMVVSLVLAALLQGLSSLASVRLPASPVAAVSYLSSFVLFSRLRASVHMRYAPVYDERESLERARHFYVRHYRSLCKTDRKSLA